ncbi:MAG: cupin domain-containing protein [Candidatus Thorarchaeota archaeon]
MFSLDIESQPIIIAPDSTRIQELLNPNSSEKETNVGYSLALGTILVGRKTIRHRLRSSSEVYFILKGRARFSINEHVEEVGVGSLVYVPPRAIQYVENIGDSDLQYLVICDPPWHQDDVELTNEEMKIERSE